ncbi:MAG: phosphoribosylamine--glycine ligase [Planctomycetota bacterium]
MANDAVVILGSGGREHALAWKIAQQLPGEKIFVLPGNPGIAECATCVDIDPNDSDAVLAFCRDNAIDFVIVGPEDPLANGIADVLRGSGISVLGPGKQAAQLEADKWFAKEVMKSALVPTADAKTFTDHESAATYISRRGAPLVIKAAGLAKGKGVSVCFRTEDALDAAERIMKQNEFGDAGARVLVEDYLKGPEVSVLALVDGDSLFVFDPAQDHKQRDDGDTGPMTGGMGAYTPTPILDDATLAKIERDILIPTVDALRRDGIDFRGILYAGLMLTEAGPKVLEYNVRFGDPECQPLMMRLRGDVLGAFRAAADGELADMSDLDLRFDPRPSCCVVLASGGYPGKYKTGHVITGIADADQDENVKVFHAGTVESNGELVTAGGRVLGVTALGDTLEEATAAAYAAVEKISFDGIQYRRDIAGRPELRGASA